MTFSMSPRRAGLAGLLLMCCALSAWATVDWYVAIDRDSLSRATYVGRESCAKCHQPESALWSGSHHDRAMEPATAETVLGDFENAEFTRFGVKTRFFRDGEKFMVHTEGRDGEFRDFEITYTFGIEPLQQYMVEFPDGRIQVLRVSWDTRQNEWFYVAPVDAEDYRIEPGDPLHWTGLAQNWNTMCAECHTTDYHKNYDVERDEYHSTYFEIDVSCEMCHGPGSVHVELAESRGLFWDRNLGYGMANPLKGVSHVKQIETCAPCHSRRGSIHPNYHAGSSYFDFYDPQPVHEGLYHADGQILDEVYVYGSFLQSKMYREGVRCTDCHDPHSLQLKYEGNALCSQCHQPGRYDTFNHHRHQDEAAMQCVNCHMPATIYMGIDDRRDHSIRVPRPDLSVELGVPNACNGCHTKPSEDAAWAAAAVRSWYGDKRPDDPHFAPAIAAARRGDPAGESLLLDALKRRETPDIIRATAIELLAGYPTEQSLEARRKAITDDNPMVRAAAIRALPLPASPEEIAALEQSLAGRDNPLRTSRSHFIADIAPRLDDWARSVRMAATSRMVAAANDLANSPYAADLKAAIADYREGLELHLDRATAHMNLAQLSLELASAAARRGDAPERASQMEQAITSIRLAIRQEPYLTGPRGELARVLDLVANDPELAALGPRVESSADAIVQLRREEAELLKRDAELLPTSPDPHYRRGMLLYLLGDGDEARGELLAACKLGPNDYDNWLALALICEQQERWQEAIAALQRMFQLRPQDPAAQSIFLRMRQTMEAQGIRIEREKPPAASD